jgi:hypothetical protein
MIEPPWYVYGPEQGLTEHEVTMLQDANILSESFWFADWEFDKSRETLEAHEKIFDQKTVFRFRSGHTILVWSSGGDTIEGNGARPAAIPILELVSADTDVAYVKRLSERLATSGYRVQLLEPDQVGES